MKFDRLKMTAFLLVGSAFTLALATSLTYTVPIGWDIHFHYRVAEAWSRGEVGMWSEIVLKVNRVPYPPLFHLLLVPFLWLHLEYEFTRFLQAVFYPLAILTSTWLMWRHNGKQAGTITAMLLLSSTALIDGAFQVKPQSIEIIMLPVATHFLLEKKQLPFILVSTLLIYTHGLASVAVLGGLFVYGLFNRWKKETLAIALASIPIIIPSIAFMAQAIQKWGPTGDNPQERGFWTNPLIFTVWYIGPLVAGFAVALYNVWKWRRLERFDKTSTLTLLSMTLMLPLWADRWLQYATVPLAYLLANKVARIPDRKTKIVYVWILFLLFLFFYGMAWYWLATRNFYVASEKDLYR